MSDLRRALRLALQTLAIALIVGGASTAAALSSSTVILTGPETRLASDVLFAGFTSTALGGGGMAGDGSFSYLGTSYASTTRGTLGATATASGSGYNVTSDRAVIRSTAEFDDLLFFSIDGVVTLRLEVQGSFVSVGGGQMSSLAELTVFADTERARTSWRGGFSVFNVSTSERVVSNLPSNYIVWLERTFPTVAGNPVPISALLEVSVAAPNTGTAQALFGNTAELMVFTQPGVTFTSRSGTLLVGDDPPIAVPAPAGWPMAVLLALSMLSLRRARVAR